MNPGMKLPSYDQALETLLDAVRPLPGATVGVRDSLNRVLAADVVVPRDMPDLPRSAVDGFAVCMDQGPAFKIVGEVPAGVLPDFGLLPGEAAAIMTGAVVPAGADCVVMLEQSQRDGDELTVTTELKAGDLINPEGDEISAGQVFATAGTPVTAAVFPALFSAGVTKIPVHAQPRVGLLVSGDEVREIEDGPAPGQIFNTNRYVLEAICAQLGLPPVRVCPVADDEAATRALLDDLATESDLIITSAGVSRGRYDHLGNILRREPYRPLLQGTAIKPGKPLHLARHPGGTPVVGMPGYPASFLTNAFVYLVPALKKLSGRADHAVRWFPVTLADTQRYRPGRTYFNRVMLEAGPEGWLARDPGSQMSSHFLNFARCQGLVRMPLQAPPDHGGGAVKMPPGTRLMALDFGWELS